MSKSQYLVSTVSSNACVATPPQGSDKIGEKRLRNAVPDCELTRGKAQPTSLADLATDVDDVSSHPMRALSAISLVIPQAMATH